MKGICASSWTITKNHCMMHGQQNVKLCWESLIASPAVNVANKIRYVMLLYKSPVLCLRTTMLPSEILLLLLLLLFHIRVLRLKGNLSGFFPWDLPVVKISPEWVTGPEQGKTSGRIATFSLWTGMFRDDISSIPDETVIPLWLGRHFLVCENGVYHEKVRMAVG